MVNNLDLGDNARMSGMWGGGEHFFTTDGLITFSHPDPYRASLIPPGMLNGPQTPRYNEAAVYNAIL